MISVTLIAALAACLALLAVGALMQPTFPAGIQSPGGRVQPVPPRACLRRAVAKAYERTAPGAWSRHGVSNFFANLADAWSAASSVLQ